MTVAIATPKQSYIDVIAIAASTVTMAMPQQTLRLSDVDVTGGLCSNYSNATHGRANTNNFHVVLERRKNLTTSKGRERLFNITERAIPGEFPFPQ